MNNAALGLELTLSVPSKSIFKSFEFSEKIAQVFLFAGFYLVEH